MTGYYSRFFQFFAIICGFELFEVVKGSEFEADLPSSAPVNVSVLVGWAEFV